MTDRMSMSELHKRFGTADDFTPSSDPIDNQRGRSPATGASGCATRRRRPPGLGAASSSSGGLYGAGNSRMGFSLGGLISNRAPPLVGIVSWATHGQGN